MLFKELLTGVEYYNGEYPHWVESYQCLRDRGDEYWSHLEMLDEAQIEKQIIEKFLNKWLSRVNHRSASSLKQAVDSLPPFYSALKNEAIEDIDFGSHKSFTIKGVMQCLLRVKPKFGSVPASKLMHMAIPRLFVMWDSGIKEEYGIPTYCSDSLTAERYTDFLKLMKAQINHAINNLMQVKGLDRETAIQQIRLKDNNLTLARIVDKYNFAIRGGKAEVCQECQAKIN